MKKILLFCSALSLAQLLFGQTIDESKPRYFTKLASLCPIELSSLRQSKGLDANESISIEPSEKSSTATTEVKAQNGFVLIKAGDVVKSTTNDTTFTSVVYAKLGYAFDIVQPLGTYYIIKFWSYGINSKNDNTVSVTQAQKSNNNFFLAPVYIAKNSVKVSENDTTIVDFTKGYYLIKKTDLESQSTDFEYKKNKWNIGILVLPAKIRPFATTGSSFDFTASFSLGAAFSYTIKHNWVTDKTFNWLFYAGVSTINIDTIQSGNTTKSDQKNIAAFTLATGPMWEKKGIQISFLAGIDFPSGKTQKQWIYRNMPWFGIGVGFSLFKLQNSDNTTTGNNP